MKFTNFVALCFTCVFLLALVCIIGTSITRVNDDEVCQVLYPDDVRDDTVRVISDPGLYWVGPQHEKDCVTRSTQHITFSHGTTAGLGRPVSVYSSEGVPVVLEVDAEFRIIPERFEETVKRTGFDNANKRLHRTARSVIRDVASEFVIQDFLIGTRQNISNRIETVLRAQLEEDLIYVELIDVNMIHIAVNATFETMYQNVENIRLQQITARERPRLVTTEEARLNETQFITRQARRNEQLQLAQTAITQSQLDQERRTTLANTTFQQAMIDAESARNVALISARTELGRIVASRTRLVSEVERAALANITLAETERRNMVVRAEGNISRALANATRDYIEAQIVQTRRLEDLVSREINYLLELFSIELAGNTSAAVLEAQGNAAAAELLAKIRAETSEWVMLRDTLSMTDQELAALVMYEAMGKAENMTVTVDHPALPLRTLEGPIASNALVSTG